MPCNDLEFQKQRVRAFGGSLVVWVDQSTDSALKKENSNGVCFAMTHEWVTTYRKSFVARSKFVNEIRDTALEDPTNRIPAIYILSQELFREELQENLEATSKVRSQIRSLQQASKPIPEELLIALRTVRRSKYPSPLAVDKTYQGSENITTYLAQAIEVMIAAGATKEIYFMLSFRRPGGGHVVGFEFNPNLHISDKFPTLHEFFDANLGLFAFGSAKGMTDYFLDVWSNCYADSGYTTIVLIGIRGFGNLS
jgi:hypothetical protein